MTSEVETSGREPSWDRNWDESRPARILVVGTGDLATRVLTALAALGHGCSIGILGRSESSVVLLGNLIRQSALTYEFSANVSTYVSDLRDVSRVAEILSKFEPDIVFNTASLQAWHRLSELPVDVASRIGEAKLGPWVAMHLAPARRLMIAIKLANSDAIVVNAAYPDAVNPALRAVGMAPHTGIGNVANPTSGLRLVAAEMLNVPLDRLGVRFVAHHYISHRIGRNGDAGGAPFALRFDLDGSEVDLDALSADRVFVKLADEGRRPPGVAGQAMTAASALSVILPLLNGSSRRAHAPGLDGRVGGYPVRVSHRRVHLDLPADVPTEAAEEINKAAQEFDGFNSIEPDGTVIFSDRAVSIMSSELKFHCQRMPLHDVEACADALREKFMGLVQGACIAE
jgi:hypothetical protein